MQNPFSDGLSVTIDSEVSGFTDGMDNAIDTLASFEGAVFAVGTALAGLAAGGLAKSVSAAADFETQMADLTNLTSGGVVAGLEDDLIGLAGTLPLTTEELGSLAVTAADVGVKGPKNILKFVEAVGKISTVTGRVPDEVAADFGRLTAVTGTPISEINNLGSSFLTLRKETGLTGEELMDVSSDAAPLLSKLGMTAPDIMSLAGTMGLVYPSADEAGEGLTSFGEALLEPDTLKEVAAALGMTPEAFKQQLENDPTGMFIQLAKVMKGGGEQASALSTALGEEGTKSLILAGDELDTLTGYQTAANKSFEEGTAVQSQFNTKMDAASSKWEKFLTTLSKIATQIGSVLLPAVSALLEVVNRGVQAFARINEATSGWAGAVTLVVTLLGSLIMTGGALVSMMGGLSAVTAPVLAGLGTLQTVVGALLNPFNLLIAAKAALVTATKAVIGILAGLNPIVLGIAAVAAILYAAYRTNFLGIADIVDNAIQRVREILETGMEAARAAVDTALTALANLWENHLVPLANRTREVFGQIEEAIETAIGFVQDNVIRPFIDWFAPLWEENVSKVVKENQKTWEVYSEIIEYVIDTITEKITGFVRWVRPYFQTLYDFLLTAAGQFVQLMTELWDLLGADIIAVVEFFIDLLASIFGGMFSNLTSLMAAFSAALRADWGTMWDILSEMVISTAEGIVSFIAEWGGRLLSRIGELIEGIISYFRDLANRLINNSIIPEMLGAIEDAFQAAVDWIVDLISGFVTDIIGFFEDLQSDIETKIDDVKTAIEDGFEEAVETAKELLDGLLSWVDDAWDIAGAIAGAFEGAGEAASTAFKSAFNSAIPSSVGIDPVTIAGTEVYGGGSISLPQLNTGGFIEDDGLAMLHSGEFVIPPAQADRGGIDESLFARARGASGDTIDVHIEIHGNADGRSVERGARRGLASALKSQNLRR